MENPFELDLETFLLQKVEYHKQQIEFHKNMIVETKKQYELLKASGREHSPALASLEDYTAPPSNLFTGVIDHQNIISTSVTYWRPRVEEFLKSYGVAAKTDEIFKHIAPKQYTPAQRKKYILAISSSLHSLTEGGKVEKLSSDGRGNRYKYKEPSPA